MIISYKKNFIFVHIYKTAGTSIFSIFCRYAKFSTLISEVWQTKFIIKLINVVFNLDDYGNSWINGVHKHASCSQISNYLGFNKFNKLYKFTFVRNTYDLLYSLWCYEKKSKTHKNHNFSNSITFEEFVYHQISNRVPRQVDFLKIDGKIAIDYIGYFEYLDKSIQYLCRRLEVPLQKIPQLNSSNRDQNSLETIYSNELAQTVYEYYKEDFDQFGYSMDLKNLLPVKTTNI